MKLAHWVCCCSMRTPRAEAEICRVGFYLDVILFYLVHLTIEYQACKNFQLCLFF